MQKFGCGRYAPNCLQFLCNAKWALFWICWGVALQGFIVNGLLSVVITTLEKRFSLRSSQSGLILSGYDIASLIFVTPISFMGGRMTASKPKYLACGVFLMGLGSLIISLPHFITANYSSGLSETSLCKAIELNTTSFYSSSANGFHPRDVHQTQDLSWTVWVFFLGQMLVGVGATPLYTVGISYIDESVPKNMSSVYLGINYAMAIVGPAIGFIVGGQLLNIYVDFLSTNPTDIEITNDNPAWIGAWWLGFVIAGIACFLVSIPIMGYPKVLRNEIDSKEDRESEAYANEPTPSSTFDRIHEMPKAFLILFKNYTFVFVSLAGACEMFLVTGFAAFLPKQMENLFHVTPTKAALLMGLISVPTGGFGTFLGGYVIKKRNMSCNQILKMCVLFAILTFVFAQGFLLHCPDMDFAGVTVDYRSENYVTATSSHLTVKNDNNKLTASCNSNCSCSRANYDPVCGSDNLLYFNACYAGCKNVSSDSTNKLYTDCICIRSQLNNNHKNSAVNTFCDSICKLLPYFITTTFLLLIFTFLAILPALTATIRSVHMNERTFALGIQWMLMRIFGTIPAPLVLGAIIDDTCILWSQNEDERTGNCLLYKNNRMSRDLWLIAFIGKIITISMFTLGYLMYKSQRKINTS